MTAGFAYSHCFNKNLPPAAPHWTGFPKFNFIGGHNDPERIPAAALADAATTVLRRRGADLALYNFDGPQGYRGLRDLVVDKFSRRPAIKCSADDVLIASGSGQGIDLVNQLLLQRGDTVILEEFTYGGALTKLKRLGINIIGAPLDDEGLKIDALARILEDLGRKGIRPKYVYTIPTVQNPTGSILPPQRREELLALTRKYGVPVFEAVEREFGTAVEKMWKPKGGIFLWLKLPDRIDVTKLVTPAAKAGVVFNPGPEWSCNPGETKSHLRLCFALPSKDDIRSGVAAFARVCFEETGIPEQSANIRRATSTR